MITPSAPMIAPATGYPNIAGETYNAQQAALGQQNFGELHQFSGTHPVGLFGQVGSNRVLPSLAHYPHQYPVNENFSTTVNGQMPMRLVPYEIRKADDEKSRAIAEVSIESANPTACILTQKKQKIALGVFIAMFVIVTFFFIQYIAGLFHIYIGYF